jgi:hypothetical protein
VSSTPGDNFAVTPISKHVSHAVRITQAGQPCAGAKVMETCRHCFHPRYGGGLVIGGGCTNGCGVCNDDEFGGES